MTKALKTKTSKKKKNFKFGKKDKKDFKPFNKRGRLIVRNLPFKVRIEFKKFVLLLVFLNLFCNTFVLSTLEMNLYKSIKNKLHFFKNLILLLQEILDMLEVY